MWGNEEYQQRAQRALPILVRQAIAGKPITYQRLADELGMSNPRTLNYPLGSVGRTLIELGEEWGEEIPPITFLVVSQSHATPGPGVAGFLRDTNDWKGMSPRQRRVITDQVLGNIYAYPKWGAVLAALQLAPARVSFGDLLLNAAQMRAGGESEAHKRLKEFVRSNPRIVGVSARKGPGRLEEALPSGDSIDVFFDAGQEWVAVEVKPRTSEEADLTRGVYQCIKYSAVLRAMVAAQQIDADVRAVLVIEGKLSDRLRVLKTMLDVEVIEEVVVS